MAKNGTAVVEYIYHEYHYGFATENTTITLPYHDYPLLENIVFHLPRLQSP